MKLKLITFLYQKKADICIYFDWYKHDFDPEIDKYFVYEARGGKYATPEWAGTVYWFEHEVVGKGLRNWWYSSMGDTSA